jgi:hypothetical protein
MPIRYVVERGQWADAAGIVPPKGAPPHVIAIAVWARGLGLARTGRAAGARTEINWLRQIEEQLRTSGDNYWATQVGILRREVMAWSPQTDKKPDEAAVLMRAPADEEDGIEKLPVTPGPIVPAREQLGDLLLEQNQAGLALKEFETAIANTPGRREPCWARHMLPNSPTRSRTALGVVPATISKGRAMAFSFRAARRQFPSKLFPESPRTTFSA